MKRMFTIFITLMCVLTVSAQRKIITQAKANLKSGSNLENVENSMRGLLKDSVNRNKEKIWMLLFSAVRSQYEQGNEKLYLKQQYDTATLFNSTLKMFKVLESFDSVDAKPDRKGNIKLKYRKKHAEYLNSLRPNLFTGGMFFIKKQKFPEAYSFFDAYIECANQPLFKSYNYYSKDKRIPEAAYWSVYCGYKMKNTKLTLHNTYLALKDTTHYVYMLQYLSESYLLEKDTIRYLSTINEGFEKYPRFPFFFPRLMAYYGQKLEYTQALEIANRAIAVDSTNFIAMFAKSTMLLNMGKYNDCISLCNKIITKVDSIPDVYLNAGLAYFNRAVRIDKNVRVTINQRRDIMNDYRNAMPFFEKYRKMKPEEQDKWALPLYTIYLNLNIGDKFEEIDKIINKK